MNIARESAWVNACRERIESLGLGKNMFADMSGSERAVRDREYDKEIGQWKRKLFWAKYGYIRAAVFGCLIGVSAGVVVIHVLPL